MMFGKKPYSQARRELDEATKRATDEATTKSRQTTVETLLARNWSDPVALMHTRAREWDRMEEKARLLARREGHLDQFMAMWVVECIDEIRLLD